MEEDRGIYMSKQGQFVYHTVSEFLSGKLSRRQAAELLEVRERTVSRLARRIQAKGLLATVHGNRSRAPWNKANEEKKKTVMELVEGTYFDFNMTHCLEVLKDSHGLVVKYETFRRWCHEKKIVKRRKRRKTVARYRRVRMHSEGLLLQMDGSPDYYNGKDQWCLIAAIDDATSDIPYAEFFLAEDTINCMTVLQKIIEKKGIPYCLYVDGAGCLGGAKRMHFTQFKRACEELGIKVIVASSAEAKGRIERAWDTIHDRIIPEMRIRNIRRMPAANHYLQEQFLPNYWAKKNTVKPQSLESKYRPLPKEIILKEIFCIKEYRCVNRNHTLSWDGVTYELTSPVKYSIRGQKIEFRTYQDLTWKAFYAGNAIEIWPVEENKRLKEAS